MVFECIRLIVSTRTGTMIRCPQSIHIPICLFSYVMFAMLMVPFALASHFAMACPLHGYLTAKAGDHNHAHFADVLK